jgi:Protein tyrosine and serine/threonine kinase
MLRRAKAALGKKRGRSLLRPFSSGTGTTQKDGGKAGNGNSEEAGGDRPRGSALSAETLEALIARRDSGDAFPQPGGSSHDGDESGDGDLNSNKGGQKGGSSGRGLRPEDFELCEMVGEGSFGKVYRAFYLPSATGDAEVAVKVMRNFAEDMEDLEREVRYLEALAHPNIVNYFGCLSGTLSVCVSCALAARFVPFGFHRLLAYLCLTRFFFPTILLFARFPVAVCSPTQSEMRTLRSCGLSWTTAAQGRCWTP